MSGERARLMRRKQKREVMAMENSSYIALSRQMTLTNELGIVANNIANANTPAYKGEKMIFREYMTTATTRNPEQISFVQDIGLARDLSDGQLQTTGNPFDVAINGAGYFVIDTPTGERYTRQGHFQLDSNNNLVTSQGFPVLGTNGVINIPLSEGEIYIADDGTISTDVSQNFAKIKIVEFEDEYAMSRSAHGLYLTDETPTEITQPDLLQGALEGSNNQPVLELTRMMSVLREYQSVQNFIKQEHERQQKAIDRLGRVTG